MFMPFRRDSSPKIISELGLSSVSSLIPESESKPGSRLSSSSASKPRQTSTEENKSGLYLKNRNRSGSALISMMLPSGSTGSDERLSSGSALHSGQRRPSIVNPEERALSALELKRNRSLLESSAADGSKNSSEGPACVDFSGPLPEKLVKIRDHLQCDVSVKLSYDSDRVDEKMRELAMHVQRLETLKSQIHDQMYAFQSDTRYTQKDTDQQLDRVKSVQQDFDTIDELHLRMEKSREKIDHHRQRLSNVASKVVELEKEDYERKHRLRLIKIVVFSVALVALVLSTVILNTDCPKAMSAVMSFFRIKKLDPIERLQQTSELPIISI